MTNTDRIYLGICALLIVGIAWAGFFIAQNETRWSKDRAICLRHGYPETRGRFDVSYCIKRENGTDVVKSVDAVILE